MNGHDEARDPHLREALRHAPDAQLQAPPQLSEWILQEAHAKARDPKPAGTAAPGWVRSMWSWLARPAVATGFAGVMAATLVGLMWWDQPMDEALPRPPAPAAAAPAVEKTPPAVAPVSPSNDTVTPAPKPEPVRKKAADASRGVQSGAAKEAARPAPMATPAPTPAPAPAAAPPTLSADVATDALLSKARAREEEHKRERSSMAPAEAPSRRTTAKAQLNESRLQFEGEAYTRVASLRAVIAGESGHWAWQRANADNAAIAVSQPMNDAVYAWLAQLDNSTTTGWQPHNTRETAVPRGRALALLRDGQLQHSFQVTERSVLWQRGQTTWQVELPTETLAALQKALDDARP